MGIKYGDLSEVTHRTGVFVGWVYAAGIAGDMIHKGRFEKSSPAGKRKIPESKP
jgi:hypothetical protein